MNSLHQRNLWSLRRAHTARKAYRSFRPGSYFVPSPRGVLDRIMSAAMGFVRITLLMAGFILVTLFALDLLDMLKW